MGRILTFCLWLLAIGLLWVPNPSFAQGVVAQSDNFVLRADAPVEAAPILQDLEAFRIAVLTDLGLETHSHAERLTLNIIDDIETFKAVSPGGITAAIYRQSAAADDIIVGYDATPDHFLSRALEPNWLRLVLRHELVHHILESHYPRKLPIWLGEGLAEYYSTYERSADGHITFGRALPEQEPLNHHQVWLPMRTVIENFSVYPDFRKLGTETPFKAQRLYYGQSWALAQFVLEQPDGLASIHRFVDAWSPSEDSEDSFEAIFGLRYDPLEAKVRRKIAQGQDTLRMGEGQKQVASASVRIDPQSPEKRLENHLRLLMTHGRMAQSTQDQIDKTRAALGPTEATPSLDLARSLRAWRFGDWDSADQAADRVLAKQPNHPTALKLKVKTAYGRVSERQSEQALWDAAEAAAVTALAVRPNDPELHLFRVAVSLPTTERLSPGALQSLNWLQARDTHLRLPHTAMMMIPALIYEDRFEQADRVLDSAARWTAGHGDHFVIERLRANVASERGSSD
jgi:hypothetical protein